MTTRARIRWIKSEEGGRTSPPPGPRYATVARFPHQSEEEWRREAWSLILDLEGTPDADWQQVAQVRFLAENGRQEWLATNAHFDLYEGKRRVASGVIVGE